MVATLLVPLALVSGCSTSNPAASQETLQQLSENELYNRAQVRMRNNNFIGAADLFKLLLQQFPFGRYSEQAQIELIYAYFMSYQAEEARSEADRFLRLYPTHQNVDYARFIKAYTSFYQDDSLTSRAFKLNYARRDVTDIQLSFQQLAEFIKLHSDSPYAPLARKRMIHLKELLAFHELWVADFYLERGAFLAAANRANWVLAHIPKTSASPWALAILAYAYNKMDMQLESGQSLDLLQQRFADHAALAHLLNAKGQPVGQIRLPDNETSLFNILTAGLFVPPDSE
ncbi:MAG: outer membrane protein assembly factor BamD [Gammaproteobacteria bacterium]